MNKATCTALGANGAFTHNESGHSQHSGGTNQRSRLIPIRKHTKRAAWPGVQIKRNVRLCAVILQPVMMTMKERRSVSYSRKQPRPTLLRCSSSLTAVNVAPTLNQDEQ